MWQGQDAKENVSVANNACWAIGEVAIKVRFNHPNICLNKWGCVAIFDDSETRGVSGVAIAPISLSFMCCSTISV